LLIGLGLLCGPGAMAAELPAHEVRVIVPFTDLASFMPPGNRMVIVPEADYRYLLDVGSDSTPIAGPASAPAPLDFAVREARYETAVVRRGLRVQARFTVDLPNPGWKRVPLLPTAIVPNRAVCDGKALALDQGADADTKQPAYCVLTQATGTIVVEIDGFLPVSSPDEQLPRQFDLPVIPAARTLVAFGVPGEHIEAWIDPGMVIERSENADGVRLCALVPPVSPLRCAWFPRVTPVSPPETAVASATATGSAEASVTAVIPEETRVEVTELNLLSFEEGFVHGRNRYLFEISGGEGLATFSLMVPPRLTVMKVISPQVEDWGVVDEAGKQMKRLNLKFTSRLRGSVSIAIEYEEPLQDLENGKYEVPELVPLAVDRVFGHLGVAAARTLKVQANEQSDDYSVVDVAKFRHLLGSGAPDKIPYAFQFIKHPNKMNLTVTRPQEVAQQTAAIDRAHAMTTIHIDGYLLGRVAYEVRNNSQQFLKVKLPVIEGCPAELWSSEVAHQPVRSGFDNQRGVFNVPIVRSPQIDGKAVSFPVEIVYAVRLPKRLSAATRARIELPAVDLPISELSWVVYLPDGYDLSRPVTNLDQLRQRPDQSLLSHAAIVNTTYAIGGTLAGSGSTGTTAGGWGLLTDPTGDKGSGTGGAMRSAWTGDMGNLDRMYGFLGLLPVKFNVPASTWWSAFQGQLIDPDRPPPFIDGWLISPRQGKVGRWFKGIMFGLGAIAGFAILALFRGIRPRIMVLLLVFCAALFGLALVMKLYQADHLFKLGVVSVVASGLLWRWFRYDPRTLKGEPTAPTHP